MTTDDEVLQQIGQIGFAYLGCLPDVEVERAGKLLPNAPFDDALPGFDFLAAPFHQQVQRLLRKNLRPLHSSAQVTRRVA
jgi:hypothetical protein